MIVSIKVLALLVMGSELRIAGVALQYMVHINTQLRLELTLTSPCLDRDGPLARRFSVASPGQGSKVSFSSQLYEGWGIASRPPSKLHPRFSLSKRTRQTRVKTHKWATHGREQRKKVIVMSLVLRKRTSFEVVCGSAIARHLFMEYRYLIWRNLRLGG